MFPKHFRHEFNLTENTLCIECWSEQFFFCHNCHGHRPQIEKADSGYCIKCDATFVKCPSCDGDFLPNEMYEPLGICNECFRTNYFYCTSCDSETHHDDESSRRYVCNECFAEYYTECPNCGRICCKEDINNGKCPDCQPKKINSHYYKPQPKFLNGGEKTNLHLGIELEVEFNNKNPESVAEELFSEIDDEENLFYLKRDGSLDNGFEIVTHPCSLDFHRKQFPWKKILQVLDKHEARCNENTGLHIHNSISSFGGFRSTTRYAAMIFLNEKQTYHFSERQVSRRYLFPANYEADFFDNLMSESWDRGCNFSRMAVVLRNETIETRLFQSTTDESRIFSCLEFVTAMTRFCNVSRFQAYDAEKKWKRFAEYVLRNKSEYWNLCSDSSFTSTILL
jgi:hypothetical protein